MRENMTENPLPDASWVEVIDAREASLLGRENAVGEVEGKEHVLPWRAPVPTAPMVVTSLATSDLAAGVRDWLCRFYPASHRVRVINPVGERWIELSALGNVDALDDSSSLHVPPLPDVENVRTFAGLMQLTRRLRGPGGCPWDREQTHASLKPYLLEEAYEVIDALDSGEPALLAEELGDLLFQVTIHAQVAAENGSFTIEDVIGNVVTKLTGRHPHVFGDMELGSAQDVRNAWESFKQREKPKRQSVLEQIPGGLPALPQSNLMQKRAASVGFEWPTAHEVLDKVEEEVRELRVEIDAEAPRETQREELGDIFFALVSVARHLKIDPEEALRLANRKFAGRFQQVEAAVKAQERELRDLSPEELDRYWEDAKRTSRDAMSIQTEL
jgi:tetrapyrrole methylase family protein / MazG family protein